MAQLSIQFSLKEVKLRPDFHDPSGKKTDQADGIDLQSIRIVALPHPVYACVFASNHILEALPDILINKDIMFTRTVAHCFD